jgi:hypothetical protein
MTPSHLHAVTSFLVHIGQATGFAPGIDPTGKIATMAVMLGEKYPDSRMFCDASATFVAFECGLMNMPSVAIIARFVERWWDKHKPPASTRALAGHGALEAAALSNSDRALVECWLHNAAAGNAARDLTVQLDVLRKHAPAGFRWLIGPGQNMLAAEIAVTQRWYDAAEHQRAPPSEVEIETVAALVRQCAGTIAGSVPGNVEQPTHDAHRPRKVAAGSYATTPTPAAASPPPASPAPAPAFRKPRRCPGGSYGPPAVAPGLHGAIIASISLPRPSRDRDS